MKPDLYTRAVLTVIALALVLIACNQYVRPATTASAQGPFAAMQFTGDAHSFTLFDQRTGDIWTYFQAGPDMNMILHHAKVSAPGKPVPSLTVVNQPQKP
jgi:hypothetical protein